MYIIGGREKKKGEGNEWEEKKTKEIKKVMHV